MPSHRGPRFRAAFRSSPSPLRATTRPTIAAGPPPPHGSRSPAPSATRDCEWRAGCCAPTDAPSARALVVPARRAAPADSHPLTLIMSCCGMPSVMHTTSGICARDPTACAADAAKPSMNTNVVNARVASAKEVGGEKRTLGARGSRAKGGGGRRGERVRPTLCRASTSKTRAKMGMIGFARAAGVVRRPTRPRPEAGRRVTNDDSPRSQSHQAPQPPRTAAAHKRRTRPAGRPQRPRRSC